MEHNRIATTLESGILRRLESDGFAPLPPLLPIARLQRLQTAFSAMMERGGLPWCVPMECDARGETMSQALLLDAAVLELALHPLVAEVVADYIGPGFELAEAQARRLPGTSGTWHDDAWHDPEQAARPRQLRLVLLLSDPAAPPYEWLARSHLPVRRARSWTDAEIVPWLTRRMPWRGRAGTAWLFDTAVLHRRGPGGGDLVSLTFHDPAVRLSAEAEQAGRFGPLLLNAGFLPPLTPEGRRILGMSGDPELPVNSSPLTEVKARPPAR